MPDEREGRFIDNGIENVEFTYNLGPAATEAEVNAMLAKLEALPEEPEDDEDERP